MTEGSLYRGGSDYCSCDKCGGMMIQEGVHAFMNISVMLCTVCGNEMQVEYRRYDEVLNYGILESDTIE